MPGSVYLNKNLYINLFDGIVPSLVGGIPAGALFFGVKDFAKSYLKEADIDRTAATIISVVFANFPYWAIRSPAEMLKTRKQVGSKSVGYGLWSMEGLRFYYRSYWPNICYSVPADVLKFLSCKHC